MYLSYVEYLSYGGSLDEPTFNMYEFEASAIINYYTFNRLVKDTKIDSRVKMLDYILINSIEKRYNALSLGSIATSDGSSSVAITSQSNDGVSVSYNGMSADVLIDYTDDDNKEKVFRYLDGVTNELGRKVLYRGLYPGE